MKKDIPILEVSEIGLALIPSPNDEKPDIWELFLVNMRQESIHQVILSATASSGQLSPEQRQGKKTADLRYFIEELGPESFQLVEAILPEVLDLDNTFWLSFQAGNYLYDKRYVLPACGPRNQDRWIIPFVGKLGIWLV